MKKEDLASWPWQWFVHLTLRTPVSNGTVHRNLKEWTRKISKKEHLQVAYIGSLNTDPLHRKHLHLLMLGRNKHGQSLLDAHRERCEHAWKAGMAEVKEVYYNLGACDYLIRNMPFHDHEPIYYNLKLLSKTKA